MGWLSTLLIKLLRDMSYIIWKMIFIIPLSYSELASDNGSMSDIFNPLKMHGILYVNSITRFTYNSR